ncbi:MAG: histidine phosphatase family protein [Kiritimatiellae bacterium]|nr:histidine phosphatase family protein [Kiritimatiellia bacterium]
MRINTTTIDLHYTRELLDQGQRVILFIRHAARPEISIHDKEFGQHLGLTEVGVATARQAGSCFAGVDEVEFFASPMERCRLTAKHLAEGIGVEPNTTDAPQIGVQGFYAQPDLHALHALMKQHGYMEYMLNYLQNGTAPYLNSIHCATKETIAWMQGASSAQLSIFVSHDIYISAFVTALGIRTFTGNDWIGFLHAAVLSFDPVQHLWTAHYAVPCLRNHTHPASFIQ